MIRVIRKDEPDNYNIDMEEQDSDQDFGVVPRYIGRKRNKNNRNEEQDVNPDQTGINHTDEMELPVMTQPETCED